MNLKHVKKLSAAISTLLIVIGISGCEKNKVENDDEAPTIEVVEPIENSEVKKDTLMRISAYLLDNHSLISYTMKIEDEAGNTIPGFDYSFSEEISDGDKNISDFIYGDNVKVPDTLTITEFYLHFSVTDENGNVGELKHRLLIEE